jgi:chromate transport protein ChrA
MNTFFEFLTLIPGLILSAFIGFMLFLFPPGIALVFLVKYLSKYSKSAYLKDVYSEPSKHPFFCLIVFVPVIYIWGKFIGQFVYDLRILEGIALFPYLLINKPHLLFN